MKHTETDIVLTPSLYVVLLGVIYIVQRTMYIVNFKWRKLH